MKFKAGDRFHAYGNLYYEGVLIEEREPGIWKVNWYASREYSHQNDWPSFSLEREYIDGNFILSSVPAAFMELFI